MPVPGLGDPVCLDNYQTLKGFKGLKNALSLTGQQIVDQVKDSGLRGRGGAAFPAGIKWQTVLDCDSDAKIYRLQCRRRGFWDLCRPTGDGSGSLSAD